MSVGLITDLGSGIVHVHDTSWNRSEASVCHETTSTACNVVVGEGEFTDVTCVDCLNMIQVR